MKCASFVHCSGKASARVAVAGLVAAFALGACGATEYFADAVDGSDAYDGLAAAWDGTHGPKKTVQAAVDLAQVGSTKENRNTVTLLPGDYDLGETAVTSGGVESSNRVAISAPILLRSLHGRATRDTTRIVGAWDLSGASDVSYFMGPRAVRCVWVGANANDGTRLEGLTFLRGAATWGGDGADHTHATGGGGVVFNHYDSQAGLVVDCAFVECTATRGGGLYNGTAVRCLFTGCRASKFGCAARQCKVYNCVFDGNIRSRGSSEGNAVFSYCRDAVNCTFVANELAGAGASISTNLVKVIYNCVFQGNGSEDFSSEFKAFNSAVQTSTNDTCVAVTETEVFSPATGDYRLTAGATATTVGSASWLSRIPEEFRYTDYYGNVRTNADGSVYAGAAQATAVPQGGHFRVGHNAYYDTAGVITCGDFPRYYSSYEQGETWPRSVKFGWVRSPGMTSDNRIVRFVIDTYRSEWPLTNDTAWIIAPASGSSSIYFQSGACVYVNPTTGSDDTATNDGTSAKPWRTIQKAVDGRSGDNGRAVVIAEPGDYCEGATQFMDCSNRIHVTSTAAIRVIAKDGPATTFITGAPDKTTPLDSKGWGIGSNAVRCVSVAQGACCAFQGFTLRGGRGSQNVANSDCHAARGAAFLNGKDTTNYKSGWLLDSVVTNCYGSRGPAIYGGIGERTYFTDCRAHGFCSVRYAELHSCLFVRMGEANGGVLGDVANAYHCTFGDSSDATAIANANAYNCVSSGNAWDIGVNTNRTYDACLVKKTNSTLPASCVKDDPYFADAANGDYRLVSGSSGMWLGKRRQASAMDFTGRPFTLRADGKVRAGAFEELVPGVRVERSVSGVSRAHDVRVVPAEGLTVTGEPYAGRLCVGLVVNGVTQDVGVVTYTVSQAEAMASSPLVIEMLYPSHFYVDDDGDDTHDGLTPETAWKTLAYASTNATFSGDVVTVLPGTYGEGGVRVPAALHNISTSDAKLLTRLVAYPGVTFESSEGADVTIVTGAWATGTIDFDCDAAGLGTNAVKCAFVADGATLRGFTFRGGRANYGQLPVMGQVDNQGADCMAAGVMGPYSATRSAYETRLVENCTIDDCYAPRGGAARYVFLRNCVVTGCGGINAGSMLRDSRLVNCLLCKSKDCGSNNFYDLQLDGCTFTADNKRCVVNYSSDAVCQAAVNCAFCKGVALGGMAFTNCAFAKGVSFVWSNRAAFTNVCAVTGVTDFRLDAAGRPLADSPLVDAGDRAYARTETDADGLPRVSNGQIDIGAYEYDWRVDFVQTLGGGALVVTRADADVVKAGDAVAVSNGTLAVSWSRNLEQEASFEFTAHVTGTGTLTVTRDGAAFATITAADGVKTLAWRGVASSFAFAYVPGEGDAGAALLSSFRRRLGCVILLR